MYIPAHFAAPSDDAIYAAMERYSFATLVSGSGSDLVASHLPLLIERSSGPRGTILGHMARANSQWQSAADTQVLAIFSGPHTYISPSWYEAEKVVPTWNYVVVHASGLLQLIDDPAAAEALLHQTIAKYEASRPQPWQFQESPQFTARLVEQIVAFRIPIERLEGKWKLNQNHPAERRNKVAAALEAQEDENSQDIAKLMRLPSA